CPGRGLGLPLGESILVQLRCMHCLVLGLGMGKDFGYEGFLADHKSLLPGAGAGGTGGGSKVIDGGIQKKQGKTKGGLRVLG
ncbi:hypothetical protein ACJ72_06845, partial [Emergomyces africanus]